MVSSSLDNIHSISGFHIKEDRAIASGPPLGLVMEGGEVKLIAEAVAEGRYEFIPDVVGNLTGHLLDLKGGDLHLPARRVGEEAVEGGHLPSGSGQLGL